MKRYFICYIFLLFVLIVGFPFSIAADIRVSSLVIDLEIPTGTSYADSFLVSNVGTEPENIEISLVDWNRNINGQHRYFEAGRLPRSLANWIEFSPIRFELKAGESQKVKFNVAIPEEEEGTHWTMFLVEGAPEVTAAKKEGKSLFSVMATVAYGIKIYQTDAATARRKGKVTNLDITAFSKSKEPEIKVKIEFENIGNTHLKAEGQVEIRNKKGQTVATVEIKRFPILPGAKRILEIPFKEKNLQPGRYLALAILDFGGNYLVAGQRVFEIGKD